MNSRIGIMVGFFAAALSASSVAFGQDSSATQPAGTVGPKFEISTTEFDIGEVWQYDEPSTEIGLKNTGDQRLTLKVRSSCGCTVVNAPRTLDPGDTGTMRITYRAVQPGRAFKTATITTNDPARPRVVVEVKGSVKRHFEGTPWDRILFQDIGVQAAETQTIRLQNKYIKPMHLRLKAGQDLGRFDVVLKEIKPGAEYDLTATTKPPLRVGQNLTKLALETGLEELPEIRINLYANVPPRVSIRPPSLLVTDRVKRPTKQIVEVRFRPDTPLKLIDAQADGGGIEVKVVEPEQPPAPGELLVYELHVTLPAYDDLPDGGAKLLVLTDDKSPEFEWIEIPIVKRSVPKRRRSAELPDLRPKQGEK